MAARILLLWVLCLYAGTSAAEVRSFKLNGPEIFYHFVSSRQSNPGLIIFLHGSVRSFYGQTESKPVPVSTLLEENPFLLPATTAHGYDVVLPVSYNQYNWLDTPGGVIIDSLLQRYRGRYQNIFIAGFSDGGTGAYRYFYTHPEWFSGLMVLNGYPQMDNFYRKVDYSTCTGKPVIFVSQKSDKVVPYEFLLTEYRRQKILNRATWFRLLPGKHELLRYAKEDLESLLDLLSPAPKQLLAEADSIWVYPPLDAYMQDERVLETYVFRGRVAKGYGMREQEYRSAPEITFDPARDEMRVFPLKIARTALDAPAYDFPVVQNGRHGVLRIPNYRSWAAW